MTQDGIDAGQVGTILPNGAKGIVGFAKDSEGKTTEPGADAGQLPSIDKVAGESVDRYTREKIASRNFESVGEVAAVWAIVELAAEGASIRSRRCTVGTKVIQHPRIGDEMEMEKGLVKSFIAGARTCSWFIFSSR
jgi:hypothetical protein